VWSCHHFSIELVAKYNVELMVPSLLVVTWCWDQRLKKISVGCVVETTQLAVLFKAFMTPMIFRLVYTALSFYLDIFLRHNSSLILHFFVTGYNDVLLIPVGATNIVIREVKSSNNYLGNNAQYLLQDFFFSSINSGVLLLHILLFPSPFFLFLVLQIWFSK